MAKRCACMVLLVLDADTRWEAGDRIKAVLEELKGKGIILGYRVLYGCECFGGDRVVEDRGSG